MLVQFRSVSSKIKDFITALRKGKLQRARISQRTVVGWGWGQGWGKYTMRHLEASLRGKLGHS